MKKLVIGTTTPDVAPGGIPAFIDNLKNSERYADCHFIEWCEVESSTQLSLGKFDRNKLFRTIISQIKILAVASKYKRIEVHSIRTGFLSLILFRSRCSFFYHGPGFQEAAVEGNSSFMVFRLYVVEALMLSGLSEYNTASYAFKKRLHENHGVPLEKIEVVRPRVHFDKVRYANLLKAKVDLLEGDGIINCIICRRLVFRVGIIGFLQAFRLTCNDTNIMISIVGAGPIASFVESEAGLDERVSFMGELSDIERDEVYRSAHFNIVPSAHLEGLGMVIYEGLDFGAVPLVTACGGMPEIVDELEVGEYFQCLESLIAAINLDTLSRELAKGFQ